MRYLKLLCIIVLIFFACKRIGPAGFWAGFEKSIRVENYNDQGVWGGHRAIYWKAPDEHHFNTGNILRFAAKHNWQLVDSTAFNAVTVQSWGARFAPVFTLPEDSILSSCYKYFPGWIHTGITLYRFNTNMLLVYPGTDDNTTTNGMVAISRDGREMAVYHAWGE